MKVLQKHATPIALIAIVCIALVCAFLIAGAAKADRGSVLPINAAGQTYGMPYTGNDGMAVQPDLVKVKADNGQVGYVDSAEMHTLEWGGAEAAGEQMAFATQLGEMKATTLQKATATKFGTELLYDSARACCSQLSYADGYGTSLETYRAALAPVEVTEQDFDAVMGKVRNSVSVAVPVYESDGTTAVGTLTIDRM
jgi:hypothetical protein